jgi:hypothetical protein
MSINADRDAVERALADGSGTLRLEAAWVAREWLPPGRRLGLPDASLDVGERGFICERWLGSTTKADNRVGPSDEGLSYIALDGGHRVTLRDAVANDPVSIMGGDYAATHKGLGKLAKIFDFDARVPFHLHPRQQHASLVGRQQKDEAYWFPPDVELGPHPETFFGLHPSTIHPENHERLLPYLVDWDSDRILEQSRAYFQVADGGFHIQSGILHGPGTALTFELQEDSDVLLFFQALNAGKIVSKDLMFKDVRPEDRERDGERFLLETVDWDANCDPYFYENHHLGPRLAESSRQPGGEEHWIYYDTVKFSGKRLTVAPGMTYSSVDRGVYNLLIWRGKGTFAGLAVDSSDATMDELLVTHERAVKPIDITNTGAEEMVVIKFFGPDINPDVPRIERVAGAKG